MTDEADPDAMRLYTEVHAAMIAMMATLMPLAQITPVNGVPFPDGHKHSLLLAGHILEWAILTWFAAAKLAAEPDVSREAFLRYCGDAYDNAAEGNLVLKPMRRQ